MSLLPAVSFLVLLGFLAILAVLALAVTKVVAPDGRGHTRGFAGGCAAALALVVLSGLGLAGLCATVAAIGIGSLADWNPVRRIEIRRASRAAPADEPAAGTEIRARITVAEEDGGTALARLREVLELDLGALEERTTVHHQRDEKGRAFTVYEVRLPLSERELARFERELERELDGVHLRVPDSVSVELE